MPSSTEIKNEMKKTSHRCNISSGAVKEMISYYENKTKERVIESEKTAILEKNKTIGLLPGLSSNKIKNESKKNTKFYVANNFVENLKKELEIDFSKISKRSEELCIDEGRKTITDKHIKQAIMEMETIGKYSIDSDINPKDIEKIIFKNLGFISDESVETITIHLCNELNSILTSILNTSKSRGRGKDMVKLEDVLDGIHRSEL